MSETTYRRKDFLLMAGSTVVLAGLAGCGGGNVSQSNNGKSSGTVTWATYDYYGSPSLIDPFTDETGIRVNTQPVVDPAEIRAKLKVGGTGLYAYQDGSYGGPLAFDSGVLQPVDLANVPNYEKYMLPRFKEDPGHYFEGEVYGIPAVWGTDSMAYIPDRIGGETDDLGVLFDPEYSGKIGMPKGLLESIVVGAIYLGVPDPFDMSADELEEVKALLIKQKPLVRTYWDSVGQLANLMATGEIYASWAWLPIIELGEKADVDIRWSDIKQGQLAWYEAHYLTGEATGDAKANTEALLNYTIGADYGSSLVEETGYRTTSTAAIEALPSSTRKELELDDPGAILDSSHLWLPPSDPQAYENAWSEVLSA